MPCFRCQGIILERQNLKQRKHVVTQYKGAGRWLLHAFGPWHMAVSGSSQGPKAWHPTQFAKPYGSLPRHQVIFPTILLISAALKDRSICVVTLSRELSESIAALAVSSSGASKTMNPS